MVKITIGHERYEELLLKLNSLRELVNQLEEELRELPPKTIGTRKKGPNAQAAIDLQKMTPSQMKQYFKNKIK